MNRFPSHPDSTRTTPAPIALRNVRPVPRPTDRIPARTAVRPAVRPPSRLPVRTTVHPALANIARIRTRSGYLIVQIDGYPARVRIERARIRWGKLAALTAAIVAPIGGLLMLAAYALGVILTWLLTHWLSLVGVLVLLAVVLRLLSRAGLHCPGCPR